MIQYFLIVVLALVCAVSGAAQITSGSITGRVTDASSASAPGARVELTDLGTQAVRTTTTNEVGEYTFNLLPLGAYRLKVELPAFQTVVRSDIPVRVNEVTRVDVTLRPGAVQEVVEVTGTPPPLQTESGEVGGVVEHQTVVQLPLNGRNFIQLVALQPGGIPTGKLQGGGLSFMTSVFGGNYSVHGAPSEGTSYLLDGIDMRDGVDTRVAFQMTVDAIQEFKFQATNYSAAFGRASGGQINIVSRSGSNLLHGALWEFLRNDKLAARNFFDGPRPPYQQNQFGAALGGAVVKDKLFYFTSYEGFRSRKGITRATNVPTVAQRAGNFAGFNPIFNPLQLDANGVRAPFPNNQIPASLQSPVSLKALSILYPLPNQPGTANNLIAEAKQSIGTDQGTARLDYRASDSDAIFFRYTRARVDRTFPWVYSPLPNFSSVWNSPATNGAIGYTRAFGPRTVNEFRFGVNRHTQVLEDVQQTLRVNEQIGIGGLTQDPRFQGNPTINISGLSATGAISNAPNDRTDNQFVWLDNVSHTVGSHNLSSGALVERIQQNGAANPNAHGVFTFNGTFTSQLTAAGSAQAGTGNAAADFLLGFPFSSARCCLLSDAFRNFRRTDVGVYFQDDWKVKPNFTLNLGLRWEHYGQPYEIGNRYAQPDFSAAPNYQLLLAGQNGVPRSLRTTENWKDFSPRFGFAYSVGSSRKTVIRGGYGIFFNAANLVTTFGMSGNPPFTDRDSFVSSVRTPQLTLANAFPTGLGIPSLSFTALDRNLRDPYNQNWNFGLQREVAQTVLSITYVGNKGVRLHNLQDDNAPLAGPGAIAGRRPIPAITSVSTRHNSAKSAYHGLELKAERRLTKDLGFLTSFVWSKCIDAPGNSVIGDGSPGNIRNQRDTSMQRGLCTPDVRRRFVGNTIYQLPFGRELHGMGKTILAGWAVTAIVDLQDGQPFSVLMPIDNSNTGQSTDTPDVTGVNPNSGPKTPRQWFNLNAFQSPVPFTYGAAGRNVVIGPGSARVDFSLHKDFQLTERQKVEFRTEFFNIFNHPGFFQPGNVFGTAAFGVISGAFDGRDIQFSLKYSF